MPKTYLKIKIMSLAAEAKIIRREERRWPGQSDVRTGLHLHRVNEVRTEARSALLAYGFLRGRPYAVVEPPYDGRSTGRNSTHSLDPSRVFRLAAKYGDDPKITWDTVKFWFQGTPYTPPPMALGTDATNVGRGGSIPLGGSS